MDDMTDIYLKIIEEKKEKVNNHIFNAGRENFSVETIAEKVRTIIGDDVNIIKKNSTDNRSYHISSKKIQKELNFEFKKSIEDAVKDLKMAFIKKKLTDTLNNKKYFNIKTLKDTNLL
jgi:nucleoside-diphosphate-sugar epimerase